MKRMKVGTVMLVEVISLVLAVLLMTGITEDLGVLVYLIDLPTLLILLFLALPALFVNGLAGDFVRLFHKNNDRKESLGDLKRSLLAVELLQKQFLYAGLMTATMGIMLMLHRLSEPEMIGPSVSVIMVAIIYTAIFELILMPLKVAIEKRIAQYMEEDA